MAINAGPKIVEDGLVFCVDAANPRSYPGAGTTWTDLTANKNNGTLTNMSSSNFSSSNGGILNFDGTNDSITVSAWINKDITKTDNQEILNLYRVGGGSYYVCLIFSIRGTSDASNTDKLQFFHRNTSSQTDQLFSTSTISNNTWTNVCFTSDTSTVRFYIDGEQDGTGTQNYQRDVSASYTAALRVAALPLIGGSSTEYFNGQISNVYMYNRVLSAKEIKQNYLATKGRFQ
jgi:hypothetical protein